MIVLDMTKKADVRITHKHYSLENGILTLQIDVGDYDLTNKTITAKFSPREVETGNLDVIDGIINLPIYSNLLKPGVNYIQLNFRWDENKLEQSPKMMWNISPSLTATEAAQEDVDIISYLVAQAKAAVAEADRVVDLAGDVRTALDESTEDARQAKADLDGSISTAGTTKTELDASVVAATETKTSLDESIDLASVADIALSESIDTAGETKTALDDSISLAVTTKTALDGSITAAGEANSTLESTIEEAGTANTALDSSISIAGTVKAALDDSISDANEINDTLANAVTGTIKQATDANTELRNSIADAGVAKSEIEQAIVDNQIVTLPVFNSHLEQAAIQRQQDNLKVALVEKELNDYKSTMAMVNINQEPTQQAVGVGAVSLPPNAANGKVSVSLKGRTLKQELNYNHDTWEEWIKHSGVTGSPNGLLMTADGSTIKQARLNYSWKPNKKYGVLFNIANNTLTTSLQLIRTDVTGQYNLAWSAGTVGNQKAILQLGDTVSATQFRFMITAGTDGTSVLLRNIQMYELPTGSEIENDFETMTADELAKKYPFVNGTKSTIGACRLRSVGKNLFNIKQSEKSHERSNPLVIQDLNNFSFLADNVYGHHIYAKVEEGKTYILHGKHRGRIYIQTMLYDGEFSPVNYIRSNSELGNFTLTHTAIGGNVLRIKVDGSNISSGTNCIYENIQLEEGTVATPYEPYTESTQYIPNMGELRSLPNGVKDEVRVSGGKAELAKRVGKTLLKGNEPWTSITTNEDNYRSSLVDFVNNNNVKLTSINFSEGAVAKNELGEFNQTPIGVSNAAYQFQFNSSDYRLYLTLPKSVVDTMVGATILDKFKAYLNQYPITLTYQLAEPIITPINVSGTLLSNPNGTVYVENAVADAGLYTDKITVLQQDLPIRELEKIAKVDFVTGVETELDVSQAVISTDKLSFTHPDLADGDIVFFTYFYDREGTLGEVALEYYDSRYVLKDDTTGVLYKWNLGVTDGVPYISLVEVL